MPTDIICRKCGNEITVGGTIALAEKRKHAETCDGAQVRRKFIKS